MIESVRVTPPEAVSISYDVAGIGSRFLAAVIDVLVMLVGLIAIAAGAIALYVANHSSATVAVIVGTTLTFALVFGYYITFETLWSGRSPGKRVMKLRVLKTAGYPISFADAAIRNLARIADFLPVMYGVGVLIMFISPESRRLGDYAAGTMVVKERPAITLEDLSRPEVRNDAPAPGAIDPEELEWDLGALTAADLQLVTELLARLPGLRPDAGRQLATQTADHVALRIGARLPNDPAQFLQRIIELVEIEQRQAREA